MNEHKEPGHDLDRLTIGGGAIATAGVVGVGASGLSAAAPIIAGIVALAVALITAVTTNKRQNVALKAEERRLDSQLAAETRRQRDQLTHDRHLIDVSELRTVIDQSIVATRAARAILANHRGRSVPSGLTKAGADVGFQSSRLATRVGRSRPIAVALADVVARLGDWTQLILDIDEALDHVDDEDIENELKRCESRFDDALRRFEDAAFEEVGAVNPAVATIEPIADVT